MQCKIGDVVTNRYGETGTVIMLKFHGDPSKVLIIRNDEGGWGQGHSYYEDIPLEIRRQYNKFWIVLANEITNVKDCSLENYSVWN